MTRFLCLGRDVDGWAWLACYEHTRTHETQVLGAQWIARRRGKDASDAVDTDAVDDVRAADGAGARPSERQTT